MPSSAYVCVPLTSKGPPTGPLSVPAELVVSPQSIVAEYSAPVEAGSGSVTVATTAVTLFPSTALKVVPVTVICASQVFWAVAVGSSGSHEPLLLMSAHAVIVSSPGFVPV